MKRQPPEPVQQRLVELGKRLAAERQPPERQVLAQQRLAEPGEQPVLLLLLAEAVALESVVARGKEALECRGAELVEA